MSNLVAIPIKEKEFFNKLVEKLVKEFGPKLTKTQVRKAFNRAIISLKLEHEAFELDINLMTHPAYSLGLTGKYQGRIHQRSKKGKYYSKKYAKPKNPKTPDQVKTRTNFNLASEAYKNESESVRSLWRNKAENLPMTGRNLYLRRYIRLLNQGVTPPIPFLP
jgi:exonuclease V gamma subunit